MGNLVFLGLVKKGYFPNQQLFYWKNAGGHEVDFALRKGGNIERLVQVSYASGREEVEKREIEVLTEASDGLKRKDMLVVTWDYKDELDSGRGKIGFTPLGDGSHSEPEAPTAKPAENRLEIFLPHKARNHSVAPPHRSG